MKLLILTTTIEKFKVLFFYHWEIHQGCDRKSGAMIPKNIKICILDEEDLRSAFCMFSQTSPSDTIEIFFQIPLYGSGKIGIDDTSSLPPGPKELSLASPPPLSSPKKPEKKLSPALPPPLSSSKKPEKELSPALPPPLSPPKNPEKCYNQGEAAGYLYPQRSPTLRQGYQVRVTMCRDHVIYNHMIYDHMIYATQGHVTFEPGKPTGRMA